MICATSHNFGKSLSSSFILQWDLSKFLSALLHWDYILELGLIYLRLSNTGCVYVCRCAYVCPNERYTQSCYAFITKSRYPKIHHSDKIIQNCKNWLVPPAAPSPLSQGDSYVVTFARLSLAISLLWGDPDTSHQYITSKLCCAERSHAIFQAIEFCVLHKTF